MTDMADSTKRCGYVALMGATNAGKSTLINELVGSKVSIITHKVQTTRNIVRGIVNTPNDTQIIFVDTPGIFSPRNKLDQAMLKTAWNSAREADVICLLVDAQTGISDHVANILSKLHNRQVPKILLLNKIDIVSHEKLLSLAKELNAHVEFEATFMISATQGDGVADVLNALAEYMPIGPWLYPQDQVADTPQWRHAADITREKLFLRLHDELPYSTTVDTTSWKKLRDGSARIEQTIYVERQSQKKIAIGKNGQAIRTISSQARHELSKIYGYQVHLFLFVKVRKNWQEDAALIKEMGLDVS